MMMHLPMEVQIARSLDHNASIFRGVELLGPIIQKYRLFLHVFVTIKRFIFMYGDINLVTFHTMFGKLTNKYIINVVIESLSKWFGYVFLLGD